MLSWMHFLPGRTSQLLQINGSLFFSLRLFLFCVWASTPFSTPFFSLLDIPKSKENSREFSFAVELSSVNLLQLSYNIFIVGQFSRKMKLKCDTWTEVLIVFEILTRIEIHDTLGINENKQCLTNELIKKRNNERNNLVASICCKRCVAWLSKLEGRFSEIIWRDNQSRWRTDHLRYSEKKGHGINVWKTNNLEQNDVHTFIAHKIFENAMPAKSRRKLSVAKM